MLGALHGVDGSAWGWLAAALCPFLCATLGRSPTRSEPCLHPCHKELRGPCLARAMCVAHSRAGGWRLPASCLGLPGERKEWALSPSPSPCPGPGAQAGWHLGRFWLLETSRTPPAFLWEEKQRVGWLRGAQRGQLSAEGSPVLGLQSPGLPCPPAAPPPHGPAPAWPSSTSSWPSSGFSVTAFRVPREGNSRGDRGPGAPSLNWGLALSREGRQEQGG